MTQFLSKFRIITSLWDFQRPQGDVPPDGDVPVSVSVVWFDCHAGD